MRILFVYPSRILGETPLGLLYLSAVLKREGHQTNLFDLTPYRIRTFHRYKKIKKDFLKEIRSFRPDLVGFSADSTQYSLAVELSRLVKQTVDIPIIFGGPHPTVDPESVIREKSIDMICIGEGEHAILDVVNNPEGVSSIPNIWSKIDGKIIRNPVRPLIEDLDSLPYPDRDILDKKILLNEFNGANFITSRGCPFQCPYCINPLLQKLYRGKGKFVRYRDIGLVIDEIKDAVKKYGIKKVTFSDETFTLNKKRMIEFLKLYKKEVALPFLCQTHIGTVDRESFRALKNAGCEYVSLGVESGNNFIRNEVLKRNMSRESIITAFKICRDIGIKTGSFNIIGIPYETEDNIWDTIELNRLIQPDILMCTIFMPFKGTELGKLCEDKGLIKRKIDESYYNSMVHDTQIISPKKVMAYAQLFHLYVNLSKKYYPFINLLRTVTAWFSSYRTPYLAERFLLKIFRFRS